MTWSYAAIYSEHHKYWSIGEVYYKGDTDELETFYSVDARPGGDTYEELINNIEMMLKGVKEQPRFIDTSAILKEVKESDAI